ncbi:hypothetical protein N8085_01330 [Salibacteraceae bacterium]|jgi:hypothetical protein|nr:hypothetical protein [Bacteroidota bacterium]MDC1204025.1 hypothetical protein [Salibacteraceae bacterium]
MKKMLMIAAAGLMIAGMTSCKKDYVCECTFTSAFISGSSSETINDTKKNAEEKCEGYNDTGVTCTIK